MMLTLPLGFYYQLRQKREILNSGKCQILEGRLTEFKRVVAPSMKPSSPPKTTVSFHVQGVRLAFDDAGTRGGYNDVNGPLDENRVVRLCISDGDILRLEINPESSP